MPRLPAPASAARPAAARRGPVRAQPRSPAAAHRPQPRRTAHSPSAIHPELRDDRPQATTSLRRQWLLLRASAVRPAARRDSVTALQQSPAAAHRPRLRRTPRSLPAMLPQVRDDGSQTTASLRRQRLPLPAEATRMNPRPPTATTHHPGPARQHPAKTVAAAPNGLPASMIPAPSPCLPARAACLNQTPPHRPAPRLLHRFARTHPRVRLPRPRRASTERHPNRPSPPRPAAMLPELTAECSLRKRSATPISEQTAAEPAAAALGRLTAPPQQADQLRAEKRSAATASEPIAEELAAATPSRPMAARRQVGPSWAEIHWAATVPALVAAAPAAAAAAAASGRPTAAPRSLGPIQTAMRSAEPKSGQAAVAPAQPTAAPGLVGPNQAKAHWAA